MSKANSLSTRPSSCKSVASPLSSSTPYNISSSLSPFFANKLTKKDSKPERKEIIGCFRCSFLKSLFNLCRITKSHHPHCSRKAGVIATQISTDQDNERTVTVIQTDKEFEQSKKEMMEFIEESKEVSSQSIVLMKDSIINRSTSNISCITDMMHKSKALTNYPLNEMFLFRNEETGDVFLSKIYMDRGKMARGRSFENLENMTQAAIQKEKMKKCISFIGDNAVDRETSKILGAHLPNDRKNVILDVSSDLNVLIQFKKEFTHVISIQSNYFVAQQMKGELMKKEQETDNLDFIVSDPLGFKGCQLKTDAVHLNFANFNAKNLEKNNFLYEMTLKYTNLCEYLIFTLPKLVSIEQILSFFGKILSKFNNRTLRIVYNITKKNQKNNIYAILQTEPSENYEEEAIFFVKYFSKEQNNVFLRENFKKMLQEKGLPVLLSYIKTLEANFTPKILLFQKFMELTQSNDDQSYFMVEETSKTGDNIIKTSGNTQNNINIRLSNVPYVDNSKIIYENTSFSSYPDENNDKTVSEETKKESGDIYSESRHLIMNLIRSKNISSY